MPVGSTHPEYDKHIDSYVMIRDVVNSDVKKYLWDIDPSDTSDRNRKYKERAQFTNFTGRTRSGLTGAAMRKPPKISLPDELEYLIEDATGTGMSLEKLYQEQLGEVILLGRYGLLVDYPLAAENLTKEEVEQQDLKARFIRYAAEAILDWEVEIKHGVPQLVLVVLKEQITQRNPDDKFERQVKDQYRVLELDAAGHYQQSVYDDEGNLVSVISPKDFHGAAWTHIPFVFTGSEDNDEKIDNAPLKDLARLNIGHYRNSADYEESAHVVGQPTLIFNTSMTKEEFDTFNPNGIRWGSRVGHNLGEKGNADLLQPRETQLADTAMKRKEEQAIMLGARLIMATVTNETAEAARMRHSGETSILLTIVSNCEDALKKCLNYALKFMGDETKGDQIHIMMNRVFFEPELDPNVIIANLQLLRNNVIAVHDMRELLRRYNLLREDRDDATIDQELPLISDAAAESIRREPSGLTRRGRLHRIEDDGDTT
jgi:hypothetical protein